MKFSVNIKKFNDNLIKLRKDLNNTLKEGYLKGDFNEKLLDLEEDEKLILNQLLVYYRIYAYDIYDTKINLNPIKLNGTYKMDTYLKAYVRISENTFIISDYNQNVMFLRITKEDKHEFEISHPVKNFYKFIVFMHPFNEEKILAFTATGDIFVFMYKDINDLFEDINNLKITKIETSFEGFENVINLNDNRFLCQVGKSEIILLEIGKENYSLEIKSHTNLLEEYSEINSLEKISELEFLAGTSSGELILSKLEDDKINIEEKVKVLNMPIKKVSLLENENLDKNICVALGNEGSFSLYNLKQRKTVNLENKDFKGNLFDIESKNGTCVVLSEDGYVYLLEENLGNWSLNKKVTLSEKFFVNLLATKHSNYLAVDLYGNFYVVDVDRLDSIEKLHNLNLYR